MSEVDIKRLNDLANTKLAIKMQDIADTVLPFECPDEYWATMDGIQLGARGKEIWEVEFDQDPNDEDLYLVAVFIDKTFDQVFDLISGLPDKLTDVQKRQVVVKVRGLYPNARLVYMPCNVDECKVVLDELPAGYERTVVDHIPVQLLIDPRMTVKKVPTGAIV